MRRHRITALVLALATAGSGYALYSRSATKASVSASGGASLRFRPGFEYRYALTWQGQQRAVIGVDANAPAQLLGTVDVAATLLLRGISDDGTRSLVEARLQPGSRHEVSLLGQQIYPDDATFESVFANRSAYMQVDHTGRVTGIRFSSQDPSVYKDTMQWLLTQTQFIVPALPENDWRAEEEGPFGKSRTHYHRDDAASPIDRERIEYTSLVLPNGLGSLDSGQVTSAGSTRGEFDTSGQLVRLVLDERVLERKGTKDEIGSLALRFELEGVSRGTAVSLDIEGLESREPGELVMSDEMREQLLTATAAGLTGEQMVADLLRFGGQVPDEKRWMWRAVGLLELDPDLARTLIEPFGKLSMTGRQTVLDVLASAATPEAQEVMRTLLGNVDLRQDGHYPQLVQRFALVATPVPENAKFLLDSYETSRSSQAEVSYASVVALGSTVGHLETSTDKNYVAESHHYNQILRDGLANAGDDEGAREAFVMALGNTKLAENSSLLTDKTHDQSSSVRSAAATALRSYDDTGSFQALLGLLADDNVQVQRAAMSTIAGRELSNAQVDALVVQVLSGATSPEVDTQLVPVLGMHMGASTRIPEALRLVFSRNDSDPRLRAMILALLDQSV